MKRRQWIELEDQRWLPESVRNGVTDFLQFAVNRGDVYAGFIPKLLSAISKTQSPQIVDLCSGGGGPWASIIQSTPEENFSNQVLMTDYFPNLQALRSMQMRFPTRLSFVSSSVSALNVPANIPGFRTLFSSFHHFAPDQAKSIIQDAISKNQGIAIAESTQRHPLMLLYMLLTPALVWLSTPFFKPFRWSRIFWTYVCPLIPFVVMFDGIVSCLRTYTPQELKTLVKDIPGSENFEWDIDIIKHGRLPVGVGYLIGLPKSTGILDKTP